MLIKRYRFLCLLVCVICGVFSMLHHSGVAAENDLEKLSRESARIKTLKADFVQKKSMKILTRPLISEGRFYFAAPDALRWEYFKPLKSVVIAYQGNTRRYIYADGKMAEDKSGGVQAMKIVLSEVAGWMTGRFDRNPSFKAVVSRKDNTVIALTPVDEKMKSMIQKIEIALAQKAGVIQSVKIFEGADSYTQINFNNVKINETIDSSVFRNVQ